MYASMAVLSPLPDCCGEFSAAERLDFLETIAQVAAARGKKTGAWPPDADARLVDLVASVAGANIGRVFPRYFHLRTLPFMPACAANHFQPHHAEWVRSRLLHVYE